MIVAREVEEGWGVLGSNTWTPDLKEQGQRCKIGRRAHSRRLGHVNEHVRVLCQCSDHNRNAREVTALKRINELRRHRELRAHRWTPRENNSERVKKPELAHGRVRGCCDLVDAP